MQALRSCSRSITLSLSPSLSHPPSSARLAASLPTGSFLRWTTAPRSSQSLDLGAPSAECVLMFPRTEFRGRDGVLEKMAKMSEETSFRQLGQYAEATGTCCHACAYGFGI